MKGFFKFLFVLIFLAVCALGIFFVIDYSRASEGQAPLFCIREDSVNDGGTVIYKGVFYKVIDYHKTINYSKNIFYDDVKIGTYGLKYEDYESEWNKLIEENKENAGDIEQIKQVTEENFSFTPQIITEQNNEGTT